MTDSSRLRFVVLRHDVDVPTDNVSSGHGLAANVSSGHELAHHDSLGDARIRRGPVHWDWMFQVGDVLRTWSTMPVDDLTDACDLEAIELPDHRVVYLEKQGDLGFGRGQVVRLVRGAITVHQSTQNGYQAELEWPGEAGASWTRRRVHLQRIVREAWRLRLDRGL